MMLSMSPMSRPMSRSMAEVAVELDSQDLRGNVAQLVLPDPRVIQDLRVTTAIVAPVVLRVFQDLLGSEVFRGLPVLPEKTERMVSLVLRGLLVPLDPKVLLALLERLVPLENAALLDLRDRQVLEVFRGFRDQLVRLALRD